MTDPEETERASSGNLDPFALLQATLRDAYVEATDDLRLYAEKVKYFNSVKSAVRAYLAALRDFRAIVISAARERGADLPRGDRESLSILAKTLAEHAHDYKVGDIEYELCIPDRVPKEDVNTLALLDTEIASWEDKLNDVGCDSQLANVDLQNALQKQQQTLQMLSSVSKMLHDTTMSIIRNIRG